MFPAHINPDPYYTIIASFLTGPELASLNWVNQELNDFCNKIEFYKKLRTIDVLQIPRHFKENGCNPLNLIFTTRPVCCTRYPDPEKFGESDDKSLNTNQFCYGSIFTHEGKKYCEGCLTEQYGEGWKRWKRKRLPRIAISVNHYLTIRGIIVNQERDTYGPTHFEDDVEVDLDGEPIASGDYWLKDQENEYKRQSFWDCGERDVSYDVIFKGPTTPWLDNFVDTEHNEAYEYDEWVREREKYKEECSLSGCQVGRLRLPILSDDYDYNIDSGRSDFIYARPIFDFQKRERSEYLKRTYLFINNYEYDVHDLKVLI